MDNFIYLVGSITELTERPKRSVKVLMGINALCYLHKNYNNHKRYVSLFLIKSALFLIQPPLVEYLESPAIFILSIITVFFIDVHIMTLKNKVDLKKR